MALLLTFIRSTFLSFISFIRPYSPHIIPILVYVSFLPLISTLSFLSGLFVWQNLAVSWEAPLYLQYGDGIPPYALASVPDLIASQSYSVSLRLVVPTTESNLGLGNFMTNLVLTSTSNQTLSSSRRAAIVLSEQSFFFRKKDTTQIFIPLIPSFTPMMTKVLARVEIGRRDGWTSLGKGEGRELNVIYAQLRGVAIPRGISGIAMRFPLTVSLISGAIFFVILSSIVGLCILPKVLPHSNLIKEEVNEEMVLSSKHIANDVETKDYNVKTEDPNMNTSESSQVPHPLRRRRSNRFQTNLSDSDN
ncbi:hypothetical protein BDQ17DRAFT_1341224 [Cyathus striatus]|nr:hypothetical protein BDQ17DRAFT_1341224 [Cyathus striatus]